MRLPVIWVLVAYCGFYPAIHSLRIIARTCFHLLKERQSLMHLLLSGFPSAMLSFPKESPFSCSCGELRKSMFPPRCTSWNPRSAPAVCSPRPGAPSAHYTCILSTHHCGGCYSAVSSLPLGGVHGGIKWWKAWTASYTPFTPRTQRMTSYQ